ncbi:hypothetical protein ACFVSQ_10325 [Streptomyces niveus]|uniref:hypothetical protein n=1 Tax=Streptomyces niveus TaxID=193462 RepID=UPI0036E8204C
MSAAHLHVVSDPDDENKMEWPAPAAALPVDDDQKAEPDSEEDFTEETIVRRALEMPDLRPYCDVRPLGQLGPLAVQAGKGGGPKAFRFLVQEARNLGRMIAWYIGGFIVLARILLGWLGGSYGKGGSAGARFGIAAAAAYALVNTGSQFPIAPWVILGGFLIVLVMASAGAIRVPVSKPAKKAPAKKGAAEKTTAKGKEKAPEVSKEDTTAKPSRGLLGLLGNQFKDKVDALAEPSPEKEEEDREEAPGDGDEEDEETPLEDPLTALLRASIGAENGVHLGVLRPLMRQHLPDLSQATDGELRKHLISAGYDPSRTFRARGVAGRAGVHRTDLPPLPSPGGAAGALSGPLSAPGERPRPANSSEGGERRRAAGEEPKSGREWVQDPDHPTAWKIKYDPAD